MLVLNANGTQRREDNLRSLLVCCCRFPSLLIVSLSTWAVYIRVSFGNAQIGELYGQKKESKDVYRTFCFVAQNCFGFNSSCFNM